MKKKMKTFPKGGVSTLKTLFSAEMKWDPFDAVQLDFVIETCRNARSLSEAGRILFARSRIQRKSTNDADRLRKYLAKFGLDWASITA